ncbi:MAG: L,D-transpeptidase [Verrucomicrobiota bacterium]|nr:L,D-transpeptidase [Verrucomicrobiota bacterium]
MKHLIPSLVCVCTTALLSLFGVINSSARETEIVVSVVDQQLAVVKNGTVKATFSVSTSKYGVGDRLGSYKTPLGKFVISQKIGHSARSGAVFKSRKQTGEVVKANSPGRDPIVTRILWLDGREQKNRKAHDRGIYIHGTPDERNIGRPVSYGCIRMTSKDVIALFNMVPVGSSVEISNMTLASTLTSQSYIAFSPGNLSLRPFNE